ncbi:MAG: hypothetical protein WBD27_11035 [Pyrinomonadaceae bacterium]
MRYLCGDELKDDRGNETEDAKNKKIQHQPIYNACSPLVVITVPSKGKSPSELTIDTQLNQPPFAFFVFQIRKIIINDVNGDKKQGTDDEARLEGSIEYSSILDFV